MIPPNITKEDVLKAIAEIDQTGIRFPLAKSYKHDLLYAGKSYPPKHTLAIANDYANGRLLEHTEFTTAQRFLTKLGDEFTIQSKGADAVKDLVERYKQQLVEKGLDDEVYKWGLIGKFRGRPDVTAADFGAEIRSVDYKNLIYHQGTAVRNHLAKDKPEEYRQAFRLLFDEAVPLKDRVSLFQEQILPIYRLVEPLLPHHHDERTIATFLTFHDPEKYALYKSSFYVKYCKLLKITGSKKNEKYIHYLELLKEFIEKYIAPDEELLELFNSLLPADVYQDENHLVLAQDILYKMLDLNGASFTEVIDELKGSMADDDTVLNSFSFGKMKDNGIKAKKDTFAWLKDATKTIGNLAAHYEISIRSRNGLTDAYFVEIHFEGPDKQKFYEHAPALPAETEWFDWQGAKSIGYKAGINPRDPELIEKLKDQLLYLETNIGDQIRQIMQNNPTSAHGSTGAKPTDDEPPLNQILFGPPGTGKTFNTINRALLLINEAEEKSLNWDDRRAVKALFDQRVKEGRICFTTFHQSMSYEDFIEGIKPKTTPDNEVIYENEDGIFKRICAKAQEREIKANNFDVVYHALLKEIDSAPEKKLILETTVLAKEFTIYKNSKNNIRFHANTEKAYEGVIKRDVLEHFLKTGETLDWPSYVKAIGAYLTEKYKYSQSEEVVDKNFVLIIDEINRGNVSQIFGELITLIEDDKRLGRDEALMIKLPYSKKDFWVPPNLYIIGTMNTADRSVEALDTALRRRFYFEEFPPKPGLIATDGKLKADAGVLQGINLPALLAVINRRIELLLNKDHLIGHSFFMAVKDLDGLKAAFQNKIIPLLQEYFYGDFGKIGLVLGKGFVQEQVYENANAVFADFTYETSLFDDKRTYRLMDYTSADSYELVISKEKESVDFLKALQVLLK